MFFIDTANLPKQLPQRITQIIAAQPPSATATRYAQILLTSLLYAMPALIALHGMVVTDPDVWWHLRTGGWIAQHHGVPRTDSFTTFGTGRPWAAYSWAFELILFGLFRCFGLLGVVFYTTAMVLCITVAVHRLARRNLGDTPAVVCISFLACFSMEHLYTPRPWLFTILFFAIELNAVLRFKETRRVRSLAILPLLFVLWVNVHIQFVDGLIILGAAHADEAWTAVRHRDASLLPWGKFALVTLICCLATLVNPYGFHIYRVAHELAAQSGVLNSVQELQAMPFRDAADWTVLALGAASLVALARQKLPSFFESVLLLLAFVLAFRSQRDVWILALAATGILARTNQVVGYTPVPRPHRLYPVLLGTAILLALGGSLCIRAMKEPTQHQLRTAMPVQAALYVDQGKYLGPIFNDYAWGGYLIWRLHQKVCIDGRAAFQGDERIARSIATWGGTPGWSQDPDLLSSNLVIGQRKAPLSQLLRQSADFTLLYEDDVAVVFMRRHATHIAP